MRALVIAFATVLTGCIDARARHAAISSGHVGCSADEVQISDEHNGYGTTTWTATCRGRRYFCSSVGGGKYAGPQVSCAESKKEADETVSDTETANAKPWVVRGDGYRIILPGRFRADTKESRKMYHPEGHYGTVVFLDIEQYAGTPAEFASERYSERTVKKVDLNGEQGVVATAVGPLLGRKMRVATAVVSHDGQIFALTCADSDLDVTSDVCKAVFRSLLVGAAADQ